MLNATNLKSFSDLLQVAIPSIGKNLVLVSDDDVSNHAHEIKKTDGVILISVLPGFTLKGRDEDSMRHNNRMLFFVVEKRDTRAGESAFLESFDNTSDAVKLLIVELKKLHHQFPETCAWKDINFRSLSCDPIRDYYGLNGYMLDFNLLN